MGHGSPEAIFNHVGVDTETYAQRGKKKGGPFSTFLVLQQLNFYRFKNKRKI